MVTGICHAGEVVRGSDFSAGYRRRNVGDDCNSNIGRKVGDIKLPSPSLVACVAGATDPRCWLLVGALSTQN